MKSKRTQYIFICCFFSFVSICWLQYLMLIAFFTMNNVASRFGIFFLELWLNNNWKTVLELKMSIEQDYHYFYFWFIRMRKEQLRSYKCWQWAGYYMPAKFMYLCCKSMTIKQLHSYYCIWKNPSIANCHYLKAIASPFLGK